jgi:hypothetical protein
MLDEAQRAMEEADALKKVKWERFWKLTSFF